MNNLELDDIKYSYEIYIRTIDWKIKASINPSQSGPRSNDNETVL